MTDERSPVTEPGMGARMDAMRLEATSFRPRECADDDWGRSESLDPDNVGDIADEGAGHRG